MNILIQNFILSTAVGGRIIRRESNRDTMIYNMARGFVANGHTVTLLASEEFRPLQPEANDFEVVYFPSRWPRVFRPWLLPWPKGLRRWLRDNAGRFDMVLSVEAFSIPSLIAARVCPGKLLVWQEMAAFQRLFFRIPAKIWYNAVCRLFMRRVPVVAMSPQARDFVSRFMSEVSDEIVGHGADGSVFFPADAVGNYFVVVSMLVGRKRIDTILRSFADYVQTEGCADISLKIIGEGPQEGELKELSRQLGIAHRVHFCGFLSHHEMAAVERQAIAMLVNTASDNNMVSMTEALANGTPVLTNVVPLSAYYVQAYSLGIVKDGWGADELRQMVDRRGEFHANCVRERSRFTNRGVAGRLCDIFTQCRSSQL